MANPLEAIQRHIDADLYPKISEVTRYNIPGVYRVLESDSLRLKHLAETPGESLHINLVLVPPEEPESQPPLRYATYVAEALDLATWLQQKGHTVEYIRIAVPAYVSQAVNGKDAQKLIDNADATLEILAQFKSSYWPNLDTVPLVADYGVPLDPSDSDIIASAAQTAQQLGDSLQPFMERAAKHNGGYPPGEIETALYINAHPPMWQLHPDPRFTTNVPNDLTINLCPQSETPYLNASVQLGFTQNPNRAITTLSSATVYAPYIPISSVREPTLSLSLLDPHELQYLDISPELRHRSGNHQVAYVKSCLGRLRAILQDRQRLLNQS